MGAEGRNSIAAVIPIHGRERLTLETVLRLKQQDHPPEHIILVGNSKSEKNLAEVTGSIFVSHPNKPLGAKWQAGIGKARELEPDAVLIMGSDDWLSNNWCGRMMEEIKRGSDLVGVKRLFVLEFGLNLRRLACLNGYLSERKNEPMGVGRVFSRKILESIHWQLFPARNWTLDGATYIRTIENDGKVAILDDQALIALDIKSCFWRNKWSFTQVCGATNVERVNYVDEWLDKNFPGSVQFFDAVSEEALRLFISSMPYPW